MKACPTRWEKGHIIDLLWVNSACICLKGFVNWWVYFCKGVFVGKQRLRCVQEYHIYFAKTL